MSPMKMRELDFCVLECIYRIIWQMQDRLHRNLAWWRTVTSLPYNSLIESFTDGKMNEKLLKRNMKIALKLRNVSSVRSPTTCQIDSLMRFWWLSLNLYLIFIVHTPKSPRKKEWYFQSGNPIDLFFVTMWRLRFFLHTDIKNTSIPRDIIEWKYSLFLRRLLCIWAIYVSNWIV